MFEIEPFMEGVLVNGNQYASLCFHQDKFAVHLSNHCGVLELVF